MSENCAVTAMLEIGKHQVNACIVNVIVDCTKSELQTFD